MFLYKHNIFTVSKNKRLFKPSEPWRTIGIYDADLMSYIGASMVAKKHNAQVSILLGEVTDGVNLICLDLDDCIDESTGKLEKDTEEFLKEFDNSEWEFSTSGTGIHIYILTKKNLPTFIVKDLEGCKSFECYTNKRHIVTTTFRFLKTSLEVGRHDDFIQKLYDRVEEMKAKKNAGSLPAQVKKVFNGTVINSEQDLNSALYDRKAVTDMYTLRGCGYKDPMLISLIDENPDNVDQSAHDAKLITKLMYYCLSFDAAWEMAKKTNYYKHKDKRHQDKFNSERYKERTRQFISKGYN